MTRARRFALPPRVRRAAPLLVALAAGLVPLQTTAENENRIFLEHVEYDAKEMLLTLHVDILDAKGSPEDGVTADAVELLASNQPLKIADLQIQSAEKAGEPIAVVVLMNASASYQMQGESESISTYAAEKEGVANFIGHLSGNDKVAVIRYREDTAPEIIYPFASNFTQAKETVQNDTVPAREDGPETIGGSGKKEGARIPNFTLAFKKSMTYLQESLDKLGSARRRFVVVMSDGKDPSTDIGKIQAKLKSFLETMDEYKIRVHTIGFSADDPKFLPLLQGLANQTGGTYVRIDYKDFATIPAVWDTMASRIKKQYVIKAKLAEVPDWGEPIKGKDEANYVIGMKVKLKDGAVGEAIYNDVRLPSPSINWGKIFKIVGIVLGGILGVGLLIYVIVMVARRKGDAPAEGGSGGGQRQQYDGPNRGKLIVLQGPIAGNTFPLIDDVTTIGSMKGNTIIIEDASVSRRHAAIKIDQMRYEVADMNSTNGVLVNGQKIHKVFLKDGDKIQIGTTEVLFALK
ncbi:MAG: FHA domain-containing protein [Myxococcales bacterium]|nr:FHA domain-containing protein [Myxococcales bacterium]